VAGRAGGAANPMVIGQVGREVAGGWVADG
jgi:hypothetical protein